MRVVSSGRRRILGIDPGSVVTGFAVIDAPARPGGQAGCVVIDCLRLPAVSFVERLAIIFDEITRVITEYQPGEMVVEDVFVSRNPASALKLGQARGAAICAGAAQRLPVAEYTPTMIKKSIVGRGAADKQQVQHMVRMLLNLKTAPQADAADAAAAALCHLHHSQNPLAATAGRAR